MTEKPKILLAFSDEHLLNDLESFLVKRGFLCQSVDDGTKISHLTYNFKPDVIIMDLILRKQNGLETLRELQEKNLLIKADGSTQKIIAVSAHSTMDNVLTCRRFGVSDYLVKPFDFNDVLSRIAFHSQTLREINEVTIPEAEENPKTRDPRAEPEYFLELIELALKQALTREPLSQILFKLLKMTSLYLKSVRCSLIEVDVKTNTGLVISSSDDEHFKPRQIDLNKYPEITYIVNTGKTVALENLDKDPRMREIKKHLKTISFNSMIVCPINISGNFYGVISARMPATRQELLDTEIRFTQVIAHILGLKVKSAHIAL